MMLHIKPRQSGKTTELCELAMDLDMFDYLVWIIVPNHSYRYDLEEYLKTRVDFSNIRIYAASEAVQIIGCEHPKYVLCDEWLNFKGGHRRKLLRAHGDIMTAWATPTSISNSAF